MKSEPSNYSIDDLAHDKKTDWTGVRNYQARNYMRDHMAVGDMAIFYHSNAEIPACMGLMKICANAHADRTAFDKNSMYYEARATEGNPVWMCVDVAFVEKFKNIVSLADLRANKKLSKMPLLQKGSRLSVMPISKADFDEVVKMSGSGATK